MSSQKVLLVNMPFVGVPRPAIGLSLLKARLSEEGIACDVAYPNFIFAEMVGLEDYHFIDEKIGLTMFVGDWLFAQYLFGEKLDIATYLNTLQHFLNDEKAFKKILAMRGIIESFLQTCLDKLTLQEYRIIGFTTTFQQNLASLALAHKIKTIYPDKIIVFGGGNCKDVMGFELHRSFPWIDYICCGESDKSFPELVKAIQTGGSVKHIPGIIYREGVHSISTGPAQAIFDLDRLPIPDYDDYFNALKKSCLSSYIFPVLLIENARGCWWGAKSQCTFCGLNGETMTFRSKSASRVVEEIRFLRDRYHITYFEAVDNIMDMRYFEELLPLLSQEFPDLFLFYEVKANLSKEQVRFLHDAGIRTIQPGIESLSTHILQLMNKGVTALQNIQLLKWCRQYGVTPDWNLLYGFPGEAPEDYQHTEVLIDALYHLTPPCSTGNVRLDRFSPYFNNAEYYGLKNLKPFWIYSMLYPLSSEQIFNLAYFFQYEYEDGRQPQKYVEQTLKKIEQWKSGNGGELVKYYGENPELLLMDTRPTRRHSQIALNGIQREIYDYCDIKKSFREIMEFLNSCYKITPDDELWVQQFLKQMLDWRLMIRENEYYLNLAIEKCA